MVNNTIKLKEETDESSCLEQHKVIISCSWFSFFSAVV